MERRTMDNVYSMPIAGREDPPRTAGLTMVIDMGSGVAATSDLVRYAGRYIDIIKISSGSAALYPDAVLRDKLAVIKSAGIKTEAGGSHFEVAYWKGRFEQLVTRLLELGVDFVEIADGHLPLPHSDRVGAIKRAKQMGIGVVTEVGKKLPEENIRALKMIDQINEDMASGADMVIVEGKASGKDVGIFNPDGSIDQSELESLLEGGVPLEKIMWEAPLREQQQALILRFGANVNIGNVFAEEVYPLELMRNGLMLMPLIDAYRREQNGGVRS